MSGSSEEEKPPDDPTFVLLMAKALELRERGIEPEIDSLVGERVDLAPALRAALGVAGRLSDFHVAASLVDPHLGAVLGQRYRLDERIGSGTMGMVYGASDLELERAVAVKVLRSDILSGEEFEHRFLREAEVLASLNSPGIVAIHDRGVTADGLMFLVMERLEGSSLTELLGVARQQPETPPPDTAWVTEVLGIGSAREPSYIREAVRWCAAIAKSLHSVHKVGVLHRDMKPSNLFVRSDGSPVLLDFGIAARNAEATLASSGSSGIGTPAYMAPEQVLGAPADPRSDVYGLGATLYHLLTLHPPYSGTPTEVLARVQREEPRPARSLCPDLPRDLVAILARAMAREPRDRYRTAADLEGDLSAFLDYRPVTARPIGRIRRGWRRLRRSREFRGAAALSVVGTVVLVSTSWHASSVARRDARADKLWCHIGPTWVVAMQSTREGMSIPARAIAARVLDDYVAMSRFAVPGRVLRGLFLSDSGEWGRAAEDFTAVAAELDTDFAHGLAARYRAAAQTKDKQGIGVEGLAAPTTDAGRYTIALHAAREPEGHRAAIDSLAFARDRGPHYAREALILQELQVAIDEPDARREQRVARLQNLHDRAVRVEAEFGHRTATTANSIGLALAALGRHVDSIRVLIDGHELAKEHDHALIDNLLWAYTRSGSAREAVNLAAKSLPLFPNSLHLHEKMALASIELGAFDEANEVLAKAPWSEDESGRAAHDLLSGRILVARALTALEEEEEAQATEFARQAFVALDSAKSGGARTSPFRQFAYAIANRRTDDLFAQIASIAEKDPRDQKNIRWLASFLPRDPSPEHSQSMRRFLSALRRTMSTPDSSINSSK